MKNSTAAAAAGSKVGKRGERVLGVLGRMLSFLPLLLLLRRRLRVKGEGKGKKEMGRKEFRLHGTNNQTLSSSTQLDVLALRIKGGKKSNLPQFPAF